MKNDACSQRNRAKEIEDVDVIKEEDLRKAIVLALLMMKREKNSQTTRQQGKGLGHTKYVYELMTLGTNHT